MTTISTGIQDNKIFESIATIGTMSIGFIKWYFLIQVNFLWGTPNRGLGETEYLFIKFTAKYLFCYWKSYVLTQ